MRTAPGTAKAGVQPTSAPAPVSTITLHEICHVFDSVPDVSPCYCRAGHRR